LNFSSGEVHRTPSVGLISQFSPRAESNGLDRINVSATGSVLLLAGEFMVSGNEFGLYQQTGQEVTSDQYSGSSVGVSQFVPDPFDRRRTSRAGMI
jgi:hypothetical protein